MKRKSTWFGVIGLFLTAALLGGFTQSGEDLFQKALRLERNEGKLMEAIELYNRVVSEGKNESLAAQAQLRIGLCYEKLGQKTIQQAQAAFQKVVDNFPDHMEVVKVAREKLSGIQASKSGVVKKSSDFTIRKVLSGVEDGLGEVSPDGRYLTFVDWNTGDLAIKDLKTGKKRRLTNKGSWLVSDAMAFQSRWSPDGKHIAFDWWDWSKPGFVGIRIVRPDGSNLRDLYRIEAQDGRVSTLYDWSPDGKNILASVIRASDSGKIVLISVSDGSMRILKEFDFKRTRWNQINRMGFSPCGKYVVYDFPAEDSPNSDIYVLSIEENSEVPLVEHPANDLLLEWIPGEKQVLFLSDRRGSLDLWRLPMNGKRAGGASELVKEGIGQISSQGLTKGNAFYYVTDKAAVNVYTALYDVESGKIIKSPSMPIDHLGKSTHSPDYSPDGEYLAYVSERGPSGNERSIICIRSLQTGKERELFFEYNFQDLQWSPNSRFLLAVTWDKKDRTGHEIIAKINVETGDSTQFFRCEKNRTKQSARIAVWSHDGKTIYYVFEENDKNLYRIFARDLNSGSDMELYRAPDRESIIKLSLSCSPDGRWLAFVNESERNERIINIIPASGGEIRESFSFEESGNRATPTEWSSDGKYILFARSFPETDPVVLDNKAELWRVSVDNGELQKLNMTMFRFYHLSMHPDGKHLAFSSLGPKWVESELWIMENFLPKNEIMKK